jgi:hypothetical protein
MTAATKKEAQTILNAARTKAQHAQEMRIHAGDEIERDTAEAHYRRCIAELEEAINDMARFETGDDD